MQRLHFLTAFIVLGLAVMLVRSASTGPGWARLGRTSKLLVGVIAFQILLGVEAWMGKFYLTLTPDLDEVTKGKALVRCLHVLTGTAVLALTAVFAVVLGQRSMTVYPSKPTRLIPEREELAVGVGDRT